MALDLQIVLYTNDECTDLYLEDTTGAYVAVTNPGGYGSPNIASSVITSVIITVNNTLLGVNIVYALTIVTGTITAATMTLGSATPVNILANLTTTVWPFVSTNPFNLTSADYHATMPVFTDQVYNVTYNILEPPTVDETTTATKLTTCSTCCCIQNKLTKANINDTDKLVNNLVPKAYLTLAGAFASSDATKANSYVQRASALCNGDCGCC